MYQPADRSLLSHYSNAAMPPAAKVNPATAAVPRARADLTPAVAAGDLYRVKVQFELDGELKLKAEGNHAGQVAGARSRPSWSTTRRPCRWTAKTGRASSAVRHYETAGPSIEYREWSVQPQLREDRRIVAVAAEHSARRGAVLAAGPVGPDELDLIHVPANSALINALLPGRPVACGRNLEAGHRLAGPDSGAGRHSPAAVWCASSIVSKRTWRSSTPGFGQRLGGRSCERNHGGGQIQLRHAAQAHHLVRHVAQGEAGRGTR